MNAKNVAIGVILVIFGAFVGYAISSKVANKHSQEQVQVCGAKKGQCDKGKEGSKGKRRGGKKAQLLAQLSLTDAQQAQIQALFAARAEQKKASREEFKTAIKAILTPEQLAQYEQLKAERKALKKQRKQAKKARKAQCACAQKGTCPQAGACPKQCDAQNASCPVAGNCPKKSCDCGCKAGTPCKCDNKK
ncbi:MAG: hypothetical protein LBU90_09685 [Bacteroidales bacterium]|jgi:Spy/CpxP family protein refolding chaperone|nr:hypothetical protein [Bacteroidales bacterium]